MTQSKRFGKHFALKRIITQTKEQRQGVNWEIQVHETFQSSESVEIVWVRHGSIKIGGIGP